MKTQMNERKKYKQGIVCAILCATLWGILPVYWKTLQPIPPFVIMTYRIVLVFVFSGVIALALYGLEGILTPLKDKKIRRAFFLAGIFISANWGIYIWAVNNDYLIQTSVGYYIEPLIVCLFGVLFFHEKLSKFKIIAILLALSGVFILLIHYRAFPTIALALAILFAVYAAIKRKFRFPAILSILYETLFLVPFALAYLFYVEFNGQGAFASGEPYQWAILAFAGIATGIPLLLFALAANRISLITLGITEYISPSLTLILGIFLYQEPFDETQMISFIIIWIGLAIFTVGELKEKNKEAAMKEYNLEKRSHMAGDVKRVTGGPGGEVFLITGSDKTAVLDAGMAFAAETLIKNLEKELQGRTLDYVILTHTHYDHVAGLPYLRRRWPELVSLGSEYGQKVLEKPTAQEVILGLSQVAWRDYGEQEDGEILMEGLTIDKIVKNHDKISLGDRELTVIETPGHTNCSLSFFMTPEQVLFHSETVGVYTHSGRIITAILKNYKDTMNSIEVCKNLGSKYIISPHYGQVPDEEVEGYWQKAIDSANESKNLVLAMKERGCGKDEILEGYTKRFWVDPVKNQQPKEAFLTNAKHIIQVILREFSQ